MGNKKRMFKKAVTKIKMICSLYGNNV
jgi:hypothetical protein